MQILVFWLTTIIRQSEYKDLHNLSVVTVFVCNNTVNANPLALTGFCIFKQLARNTAAASASHLQVEKSTRKKKQKKEGKQF